MYIFEILKQVQNFIKVNDILDIYFQLEIVLFYHSNKILKYEFV